MNPYPNRAAAVAAAARRIFARSEAADDGCVLWTGPVNSSGYAMVRIPGLEAACAHRVTTEWASGPIADGMTVDHLCHSRDLANCPRGACAHRRCVNPEHLEVVTFEENLRRGMSPQATHCKYGHEFTPENTYVRPRRGARYCRACNRARGNDYYARKRALARTA